MSAGLELTSGAKNRFLDAPRNADYTIDQDWQSYTDEEHDRWDRLYARAERALQDRACPEFLQALPKLRLSERGIPDMARLSDRLRRLTGWQVVPVIELVPDDVFFDHLANRRFPAGAFIRSESEIDDLQEPDIFHDIFGHVPLLANPVYADFLEAYGKGGRRAMKLNQLHNLARLYWYTIKFGLLDTDQGLRIFGGGILSSASETVFALENPSPHRIRFDIERVMRTTYHIDDFQRTYFIADSFDDLREQSYRDFGPLYDRLKTLSDIDPENLLLDDDVINAGSLSYFAKAGAGAG